MSPVDYLEKLQTAEPGLAEDVAELASLYQRKLWHQLTLKVEDCFSKSDFNKGELPLEFYNNFINDFGHKINLLKLSQFAVHVAKHIPDAQQTVAFLQGVAEHLKEQKLPRSEQPLLFLKMHVAQQKLEMGSVQDCKVWCTAGACAVHRLMLSLPLYQHVAKTSITTPPCIVLPAVIIDLACLPYCN
eukprot:GHRQ01013539.1.p1 GENE.GHRQ01013539.1~~GHRQ01013539.1.p1  ORF type:complete len:187 (+),score=44.89 GHRQ01013539.1:285-845(+)